MLYFLSAANHAQFSPWLTEMYRLRYRVFKERLAWSVETAAEQEIDRFDAIGPSYIIYLDGAEVIRGCVRLIPTSGPNMLRDVFPDLIPAEKMPRDAKVWESSRFAVDLSEVRLSVKISPTLQLFAGMIEFGLAHGLDAIVTVTDTRVERILRRAKWPLRRFGAPKMIGSTEAVAGLLEISADALTRVREVAGVNHPLLWAPVLSGDYSRWK